MRRLLLALLLVLAPSGARAAWTSETLALHSATYSNFRQLLMGAAPDAPLDLPATLGFPANPAGPVPAVVLVHTAAGFRDDNEGWQAERLREAGFATLTYDSFAARGLGNLVTTPAPGPPPYPSALADAFAALAALARDPRIDPARIAILGFSFGGEVAHDAAFERIRAALATDGERFAAHVAYYPAGVYGVVPGATAYTGAPILMMVGGDDTLPAAKAKEYLAYATAAGHPAPIELLTYPGAAHGWTIPGLGAVQAYPYLASTRDCPFVLITAHAGLMFLVAGREQPFEDSALRSCIARNLGYDMGYDEAVRRQSTDAAIAFLKRHLSR